MTTNAVRTLLLLAATVGSGCETTEIAKIEKSASADELRKETTAGVTPPTSCPTLSLALPAGQSQISVSYQEPQFAGDGRPITDLAYTTIYVLEPKRPARAIRVWTNDSRGGGQVEITDISVSGQEVGLCVTATNWARQESAPAQPAPPKK